ncbi:MAG: hypothetical protein JWL59_3664 [Chthoniobacteraceae bacterium]|nr:hypothetical protein [Chthoniobacteraceae bacterium]
MSWEIALFSCAWIATWTLLIARTTPTRGRMDRQTAKRLDEVAKRQNAMVRHWLKYHRQFRKRQKQADKFHTSGNQQNGGGPPA